MQKTSSSAMVMIVMAAAAAFLKPVKLLSVAKSQM
jgi:hypothetical protein